MTAVLILFLGSCVGLLTAFILLSPNTANTRSILSDLGLHAETNSIESTPFYKWGWYEESENRVSAEHIVKKAFDKAGMWLTNEDLAYFETICKKHQKGETINEEEIKQRIKTIVSHNEAVRSWVHEQIRKTIALVQNISTNEAIQLLLHAGVDTQPERAKSKLIGVEFRRALDRVGFDIMGYDQQGIQIVDPKTEETIGLLGLDAWKKTVHIFEEEITKEMTQNHLLPPVLTKSLKAMVENGYLNELTSDIQEAEKFRKQMNRASSHNLTQCDPEAFERILYTWKWTDGISFNQNDHHRVRELFLRDDLSPRMRDLIYEKINEDFESIQKLIRLFPRYVIFYGDNSRARSFACDQYYLHFSALLDTFSSPANTDSMPPTILTISNEQFEEIRKSPNKGQNKFTLKETIERKQDLISVDLSISREVIHNRGWIINLGTDSFSSEELEMLNKPPFKKYFRFCCDPQEDVDFVNNTYNAKQSRVQFFTLILDSLVDISPISKKQEKTLSSVPDK